VTGILHTAPEHSGRMPSLLHEAPLELLRRNPSLASALLTGIPGVAVPGGGPASLAPGEVTASLPVELRADAVVLLHGDAEKLAVVGRAKTILQVLAARGVAVQAEIRDQVLACTDIAQLDAWVSKAATAETVDEVFGEANGKR
jgi:hypothetical protein